MSVFPDRPLGEPIPDSPHAVSVSLPTMRAVRGYEEKDPEITRHLKLGYPRFVVHPFAAELAAGLSAPGARFAGRKVWLVTSAGMAELLAEHLTGQAISARDQGQAVGAVAFEDGKLFGVAHDNVPALATRAKLFLQHVGGFVGSRQAEDELIARGLRAIRHPERAGDGPHRDTIVRHLLRALPGATPADVFLAPNGMNAIYAAYRAVTEVQAVRGRTEWVQLGWLYLDSIAILRKFTPAGGYHHQADVFDLAALEDLFVSRGPAIAGLITEIPTNPLIQTPDVAALAALCRRYGVFLILDPSVASAFNVNALPFADLVVSSLTKYTSSDGDVIAGMVAVNPAGPSATELRRRLPRLVEPVYGRDLARLAAQIPRTEQVLARINESTPRVAEFLAGHPGVAEVHWALAPASAANFLQVGHRAGGPGGMISFAVKGDLARFYDRLRLAKGPSFGMTTTLICPFMYLAHYDLVTTEAGRAELAENRLSPDLLRLCIGTEPAEQIIAALDEALRGD